MKEVSVIISGGGSVGLSLAAELGWRGINCMILEQF
jgi:2-polyprenyl-6-methoxyphenol hydroxylase-like FAD-dependent oxidoreductase